MSQNKKSPAVMSFRAHNSVHNLDKPLQGESYLVPKTVKDMGQLIGLWADARLAEWDDATFNAELLDAYRELATTTSQLLSWYSVEAISDEAVHSVSHRLAATVNPLVSLHARVDHLYRAFIADEPENVRDDVQKLWAALEFRCEAVTNQTFAQLLTEA